MIGFTCQCLAGFSGETCENNINDCVSNPCLNGGECIDGINGYTCKCTPEFMGPNCNEDFDACGSNNCQNGGICQSVENNTHYICQCPVGFSGQMCEENIDDCIGKEHSFNKNNEQNLQ